MVEEAPRQRFVKFKDYISEISDRELTFSDCLVSESFSCLDESVSDLLDECRVASDVFLRLLLRSEIVNDHDRFEA